MKDKTPMDKLIEKGLKATPKFNLSDNFADIVAAKAHKRYSLRIIITEYLIYTGIIFSLLLIASGLIVFLNWNNLQQLLETLSTNLTIIISVAFILNFILFADKVLLRMLFLMKK